MPRIFLYAEILTHIRQLTLYASLQTEKKEGTEIDVSSNKRVVTVVHEGESQSIYLPTQISGNAQLTFPLDHKTEISVRLQIDDLEEWQEHRANGIEAPWQASDLTKETALTCRNCSSQILSPSSITTWKSLPSENWAELVDLWFCHKPHSDEQGRDDGISESQGLPFNNKINVARGVGLTDLVSFMLHSEDCQNVQAAEAQSESQNLAVCCKNCSATIGSMNMNENSIRVYKSATYAQLSSGGGYENIPTTTFVCAQLLSLIEGTSTRKIVVHGHHLKSSNQKENTKSGLLLWIFNPDIYYSSSNHTSATANTISHVHRAAKVFYKPLSEPLTYLEENHKSVEELVLPTQEIFFDLQSTLKASNSMLPQPARKFQDWDVGLLNRYEKCASGQAVMDQNPLTRQNEGQTTKLDLPLEYEAIYTCQADSSLNTASEDARYV